MTLSLEMNKVLKSLDSEQIERLFKTIDPVKTAMAKSGHDYGQKYVSTYWFKIAMNTSWGTIPIDSKLYIHIMTEHKIGDPADPSVSTFIRDIPISYLRDDNEIDRWLAEYRNIIREIKLSELV